MGASWAGGRAGIRHRCGPARESPACAPRTCPLSTLQLSKLRVRVRVNPRSTWGCVHSPGPWEWPPALALGTTCLPGAGGPLGVRRGRAGLGGQRTLWQLRAITRVTHCSKQDAPYVPRAVTLALSRPLVPPRQTLHLPRGTKGLAQRTQLGDREYRSPQPDPNPDPAPGLCGLGLPAVLPPTSPPPPQEGRGVCRGSQQGPGLRLQGL